MAENVLSRRSQIDNEKKDTEKEMSNDIVARDAKSEDITYDGEVLAGT